MITLGLCVWWCMLIGPCVCLFSRTFKVRTSFGFVLFYFFVVFLLVKLNTQKCTALVCSLNFFECHQYIVPFMQKNLIKIRGYGVLGYGGYKIKGERKIASRFRVEPRSINNMQSIHSSKLFLHNFFLSVCFNTMRWQTCHYFMLSFASFFIRLHCTDLWCGASSHFCISLWRHNFFFECGLNLKECQHLNH